MTYCIVCGGAAAAGAVATWPATFTTGDMVMMDRDVEMRMTRNCCVCHGAALSAVAH